MWMPLTCFQVAVPSCWDICTCQWDQRDFGPSTNTTSLHRSFRRIYTFWQSNHAKSENPWKIHGNFSRVSEFPKLAFFFGRQQFPSIRCGLTFPAEATLIFEDQNAVLLHVIFDPGQTKCDLDTLPPKISKMPC